MTNHPTITRQPTDGISRRAVALIAGIGLLIMAVLAPLAHFGVLQNLVVPEDTAATLENITASERLFRVAIAALLIVTFLDILVAWALYVLLRPVNAALVLLRTVHASFPTYGSSLPTRPSYRTRLRHSDTSAVDL